MKSGLGGELEGREKQSGGMPNKTARAESQQIRQTIKRRVERSAHGERQRVGGRVRWRSIGWPQWGQSMLGREGVSVVSAWGSAEEGEVVNWPRCCWRVRSRERRVAPKKP